MTEELTEVTPEQTTEVADTSTQEPAQADTSTAVEPETVESEATNEEVIETQPEWLNKSKYKTVEEQAKAYSELESKATKDAIELAEARKRLEELSKPKEPSIVDEAGNVSKEFREKHQFELDNNEFTAYENISRGINDLAVRQEVENLLREAQSVYGYDKNAYSQVMDRVKEYFAPSVVEKMTKEKIIAEQQFEQKYKTELQKSKEEKASLVAKKIETVPELYQLVNSESESFSPETFTIVKQLFDKYGDIDVELTTKAITSIKALGVKEHLAKQQLEATKQSANVSTGSNVQEVKSDLPTAQELAENPSLYTEAVKKHGMEKIDAIIAGKT